MTVFGFVSPGRTAGRSRAVKGKATKGRGGSGRSSSKGRNVHVRKTGKYGAWKPPVPEPLAPAPLLGPKELGALGALVLAGAIWGWLNSRPPREQGKEVEFGARVKGMLPPEGNTTPAVLRYRRANGTATWYMRSQCDLTAPTVVSDDPWQTLADVVSVSGVKFGPRGDCGPKTLVLGVELSGGRQSETNIIYGEYYGWKDFGNGVEVDWLGPGAVPADNGSEPVPLPPGWEAPRVPEPEASPEAAPEPWAPPLPIPVPQPQPEPETSEPGNEPGLENPPPEPGKTVTTIRVTHVNGQPVKDGVLVQPKPDPVKPTNPDWHYPIPGGGPITGNGPQPKPEEVAKELGRLEQKLNALLNPTPDTPVEWRDLLQQALEAFMNLKDGTTYTITEKCPPCDGGQYDPPKVEANAPGALNAFGVITNRLDAIAALLDGQLGLKQQVCPPCRPTIRGELVTINFQSDPAEVPSRYAIKKHLSYRDQSGRDEEFHIQHWQGFSWDTGAAIVTSKGLPWGIVKVWAVDYAEGQRVIAHAATAAGVNLNDPKHEWVFSTTDHPRYGRQGTVWPVKWDESGKLMISKRGGPSGLPGYKRNS